MLLATFVFAQESRYEIKVGNPLRKTVLDVIRQPTEAELGQKVEFVVSVMLSKGDWAFAHGQLQQKGGAKLDYTKFTDKATREQANEGLFDDNFQALLRRKNGKWTIVKRALGCTDVCWSDWGQTKGVPREVIPQ
jgi:hypothetical protein